MYIHENLKRLRKERALTQEDLASALGVSFQSVSKWERGECYPDMEMLPRLALFFDVSLDLLLGMDQMRDQSRLGDVFYLAHEYEADGRYPEAVDLLRQALRDFPGNDGLLSELALALTPGAATSSAAKEEAIALSQRVLDTCTNEKIRSTTRTNLCLLYARTGEADKALALAKTLPHLWESREILLCQLTTGQDQRDAFQKTLRYLFSLLQNQLDALDASGSDDNTALQRIALGVPEIALTPRILAALTQRINRYL